MWEFAFIKYHIIRQRLKRLYCQRLTAAFSSDKDFLWLCFQSSVTEVETLQRKQTQFEEALEARVDQMGQVEQMAQKMIQQKHYDADNIRNKSRMLATRSEHQHCQ